MRAVRTFGRALIVVAAALASACGVSDEQEVAIGRQNADQINARIPIVRDPVLAEYVQQLGLSIARTTSRADLDWHCASTSSRAPSATRSATSFAGIQCNR